MNRKLASLQIVRELVPIEGADKIELARVLGWQCVVKKGEFAPGDLGVFFEVDAIPPRVEAFEFLWTGRSNPDKVRITTMKLRGQLSQGLMIAMATIDEVVHEMSAGDRAPRNSWEIGEDLTEFLGVRKYEPIVSAEARGPMPSFIPKTDEPRVQSYPFLLTELHSRPYVITEKIDGTSATFLIDPSDDTFHVCGRTQSLLDSPGSVYWQVARKYNIAEVLRHHSDYAIQGEIYGPGIQGNRLDAKEIAFAAFNVYSISNASYLGHVEAASRLFLMNIPMVSVIEKGSSFEYTQQELLAMAEGKYTGTKNEREGIVIRPLFEARSEELCGDRLSFKAISNRFLLKGVE